LVYQQIEPDSVEKENNMATVASKMKGKGKPYRGEENISNGLAVKARKQYQPSEGMRARGSGGKKKAAKGY